MYIAPNNIVHSDFPHGSYYIKNDNEDIRNVIKISPRHQAIMDEVTRAISLGLGQDTRGAATGQYTEEQMLLPLTQAKLQLLAYTRNLTFLQQILNVGGGAIKKKKN